MKLARQLAKVRLAQAEVRAARARVGVPVDALLDRVRTHPLTSVGAAAGVGAVMAQMHFHPLRVPGVSGLLTGGVIDLVGYGARLLADGGFAGAASGMSAAESAAEA
ncbi:MAG TPA: hypothetical protein VFW82_02630 [Dyella sp.]|nr:hypothetical protein [Dyella sp.]